MKVLVMFQRECVREVEPNARESMSEVVGFEPQIQQQHHPRLFLRNFLSLHECRVCSSFFQFYSILYSLYLYLFPLWFCCCCCLLKELEFIHKSSSTVGYRPNVFSTTLSHLIATNSSHFLIPFIPIRGRPQL